jgi:hypothetical protein
MIGTNIRKHDLTDYPVGRSENRWKNDVSVISVR